MRLRSNKALPLSLVVRRQEWLHCQEAVRELGAAYDDYFMLSDVLWEDGARVLDNPCADEWPSYFAALGSNRISVHIHGLLMLLGWLAWSDRGSWSGLVGVAPTFSDLQIRNENPPPLWVEPSPSDEQIWHAVSGMVGLLSLMIGAGLVSSPAHFESPVSPGGAVDFKHARQRAEMEGPERVRDLSECLR